MNSEDRWYKHRLPKLMENLPQRIQDDLRALHLRPSSKTIESSYLYGQVGSGKTTWAAHMMLEEARQRFMSTESSGIACIFANIPELLFDFRSSYNDDTLNERKMMESYSDADFLVLDDFGIEKITDWSFERLYLLINRRYNVAPIKKTVITSNFSLEQIAEQLGDDRLSSRIQHMCLIQKFEGDYRIK